MAQAIYNTSHMLKYTCQLSNELVITVVRDCILVYPEGVDGDLNFPEI
jgi:hypothetical protein